MDTNEWCAITHIDFRPSFADRGASIAALQAGNGPSLEEAEQVLRVLVAAERPPGTVDLTVLQQLYAANHFEVIGRFSSEAAYEAHLISTATVWRRPSPPRTRTGCIVPAASRPGPVRVRATLW
jgi:quinol monooxygenase YgiN